MNFLKKTKITNFLFIVLISFSTLGANRYKFVPVEQTSFIYSSNHYAHSSIINQQTKLIGSLIMALQEQSKSLTSRSYIVENDTVGQVKTNPKQEIKTEDGKLKKLSIFFGRKTLDFEGFVSGNFLEGLKEVFARGLKRAGSLSIYLPIVAFAYWRITGRSPIIPIKELYRFSKFLIKEIFIRPKLSAGEEIKTSWIHKFNKLWEIPANLIFGKENPEDFKNRFSPDEIFYGGSALLAYLIFLR